MAGCRAVEEILARDATKYRISIFGAEPRVNYNRIMLSPLLAGEKSFDDIVINDQAWYDDNDITLVSGDQVMAIDRKIQTVTARSGRTESYDKLILATGSDPFIIPVPGHDLQGVVTFRDMDDVGSMLEAANRGGDAVVVFIIAATRRLVACLTSASFVPSAACATVHVCGGRRSRVTAPGARSIDSERRPSA